MGLVAYVLWQLRDRVRPGRAVRALPGDRGRGALPDRVHPPQRRRGARAHGGSAREPEPVRRSAPSGSPWSGGAAACCATTRRAGAARRRFRRPEIRSRRGGVRRGAAVGRPAPEPDRAAARRRPAARGRIGLRRGVRRRGGAESASGCGAARLGGAASVGAGVLGGRRLGRAGVGGLRRGVGRRRRVLRRVVGRRGRIGRAPGRPGVGLGRGRRGRRVDGRAGGRVAVDRAGRRVARRGRGRRSGGASSARVASASAVRPDGPGRLAAVICTGTSGLAAATSGVAAAGGGGRGGGARDRRGGAGQRAARSSRLADGGRRRSSGSAARWSRCRARRPSGPEPAGGQRAGAGGGGQAGQAGEADRGPAADRGRLRGERRAAGGLGGGLRRGQLAHRSPRALRARPGVAEGQDVAAQQREAGADQRASHDRAGEPREGDPGPSGTESNHSGRNIDANGQSLKSQEWAVCAPESRSFACSSRFPRRPATCELGALALVLATPGSAALRHPPSGRSNIRRPAIVSRSDLPQSFTCASHAAARRPRWSSPSSPCSSRSAAPPRPRSA